MLYRGLCLFIMIHVSDVSAELSDNSLEKIKTHASYENINYYQVSDLVYENFKHISCCRFCFDLYLSKYILALNSFHGKLFSIGTYLHASDG